MNMKYLKPASAILVGTSVVRGFNRATTEECTATLGLTTVCSDGSGEQLHGIYVTRSQLEQIRDEIDNYLQNTAEGDPKLGIADSLQKPETTAVTFNINMTGNSKLSKEEIRKLLLEIAQRVTKTQERQSNDTEQKQRLRINPQLVRIEQARGTPDEQYRAIINQYVDPSYKGSINLCVSGSCEEKVRAALDAQFEALVFRCVDTAVASSGISSATSADNSEKVDNTPGSKGKKTELSKTKEKSQVFKLNPNRVTSRIDPTIQSYSQWEARTTLYFGKTPLEVVSSGHSMEDLARTALDRKVEKLINGMTD